LARETVNITTSGEPQRQLAELGVLPLTLTRERFRDMIRSDIGKWRKVIEQAGVRID
jgi:tripartite-type tricarboxylate transporter receptor subunit TctC